MGSGPGVELGVVWVWSVGGEEVGFSGVRTVMGERGGEVVGLRHERLSCVVLGWSVCVKGVVVGRVRSMMGEGVVYLLGGGIDSGRVWCGM